MNKYHVMKMFFFSVNLTLVGCSSVSDSVNRDDFVKLQGEVSQLKNKVSNQALIIGDLNARTNALQRSKSDSVAPVEYPDAPIPPAVAYHPPSEDNTPFEAVPPEKSRYNHAYGVYKSGAYHQAMTEFQSFIRAYPNSEYADNAQFWIGECLLKKGDEAGAKQAFGKVIQNYPTGNKVQDAQTKLRLLQRN